LWSWLKVNLYIWLWCRTWCQKQKCLSSYGSYLASNMMLSLKIVWKLYYKPIEVGHVGNVVLEKNFNFGTHGSLFHVFTQNIYLKCEDYYWKFSMTCFFLLLQIDAIVVFEDPSRIEWSEFSWWSCKQIWNQRLWSCLCKMVLLSNLHLQGKISLKQIDWLIISSNMTSWNIKTLNKGINLCCYQKQTIEL
jgi:hypothetical protein